MRLRKCLSIALPTVLTLTLLSGCGTSELEVLDYEVSKFNRQVTSINENHKEAKDAGKLIETAVSDALKTGDTSFTLKDMDVYLDVEMGASEGIYYMVNLMTEYINSTKDNFSSGGMGSFEEGAEPETEMELPSTSDYTELVENHLEVHYFLDDKRGITEQTFLLRLPNGWKEGFTLKWSGKVVVAYEALLSH